MSFRSVLVPVALASALALPAAAFAQSASPQGTPAAVQGQREHRGGFMRLLRGLNLTPAQETQIKNLRAQFRQAHPRGSKPDKEARKQLRDQIMAVLTPQQRQQLQDELKSRRKGGSGSR